MKNHLRTIGKKIFFMPVAKLCVIAGMTVIIGAGSALFYFGRPQAISANEFPVGRKVAKAETGTTKGATTQQDTPTDTKTEDNKPTNKQANTPKAENPTPAEPTDVSSAIGSGLADEIAPGMPNPIAPAPTDPGTTPVTPPTPPTPPVFSVIAPGTISVVQGTDSATYTLSTSDGSAVTWNLGQEVMAWEGGVVDKLTAPALFLAKAAGPVTAPSLSFTIRANAVVLGQLPGVQLPFTVLVSDPARNISTTVSIPFTITL